MDTTNSNSSKDRALPMISRHNLFRKWEFLAKNAKTVAEKELVYEKLMFEALAQLREYLMLPLSDDIMVHLFIDVNESVSEFTYLMDGVIFDVFYKWLFEIEMEEFGTRTLDEMIQRSKLGHYFDVEAKGHRKEKVDKLNMRHTLWKLGVFGMEGLKQK